MEVKWFEHPIELQAAIELHKGVRLTAPRRVRMDIRIDLSCGQLRLRNAYF